MTRETDVILQEMIDVMDHLQAAIKNHEYETFQKDWILRHAAQRALEIVSEASRHIPEHLRLTEPETNWAQIRAIGNLLRHEYHRASDKVIWNVITEHFNELRPVLIRMLARL